MVSKKVTITNAMGFHMRPASNFAAAMGKYPCKVTIKANGNDTDGTQDLFFLWNPTKVTLVGTPTAKAL